MLTLKEYDETVDRLVKAFVAETDPDVCKALDKAIQALQKARFYKAIREE